MIDGLIASSVASVSSSFSYIFAVLSFPFFVFLDESSKNGDEKGVTPQHHHILGKMPHRTLPTFSPLLFIQSHSFTLNLNSDPNSNPILSYFLFATFIYNRSYLVCSLIYLLNFLQAESFSIHTQSFPIKKNI
mgnify:CR=1 FL=1